MLAETRREALEKALEENERVRQEFTMERLIQMFGLGFYLHELPGFYLHEVPGRSQVYYTVVFVFFSCTLK